MQAENTRKGEKNFLYLQLSELLLRIFCVVFPVFSLVCYAEPAEVFLSADRDFHRGHKVPIALGIAKRAWSFSHFSFTVPVHWTLIGAFSYFVTDIYAGGIIQTLSDPRNPLPA